MTSSAATTGHALASRSERSRTAAPAACSTPPTIAGRRRPKRSAKRPPTRARTKIGADIAAMMRPVSAEPRSCTTLRSNGRTRTMAYSPMVEKRIVPVAPTKERLPSSRGSVSGSTTRRSLTAKSAKSAAAAPARPAVKLRDALPARLSASANAIIAAPSSAAPTRSKGGRAPPLRGGWEVAIGHDQTQHDDRNVHPKHSPPSAER